MADGHIIVAAQIDWTGGLVQVTDTTLRIDAALLEDGQFEPRLLGSVSWGEAARHPYQSQAGELVVGNLTLANADGGLDALATGDVVGAEVELRRGSDADRWADLEFVFVARVSGVRLNGRSEIVLELENVLADLAGPVFSDKFADTVPNPQLEGKDIPLVLGKVKQAPVLEFNPANLTYYTATNASLIGQVAEGGNPTQRWTLEDQPTFNLLGSPSLPITADFEGPGESFENLATNDDFADWTSGEPDGWTASVFGVLGNAVTEVPTGVRVSPISSISVAPAVSSVLTSVNEGLSGLTKAWTITAGTPYDADITVNDLEQPEQIKIEVTRKDALYKPILGSFTVTAGLPVVSAVAVYDNGLKVPISLNTSETVTGSIKYTFATSPEVAGSLWDGVTGIEDLASHIIVTFGISSGTFNFRAEAYNNIILQTQPIKLYPTAPTYNVGDRLKVIFDYEAGSGGVRCVVGALDATNFVYPNPAMQNYDFAFDADGGRVIANFTVPDLQTFALAFYNSGGAPNVIINRIQILRQRGGDSKYATLVDEALTAANIPLTARDSASISAHATAAGNPDLGWLVKGDETVDQILFRLAGSLGGYVWHGLDGKVRSKRLALPTDPGGTPFTIDESRADIDEISAFDDPAPQLTTRVNALRNWQPIDPDRQAGITSTWTESDRAAAAADWRITRVYAADADYKRRWAAVESREPYSSALIDATAAQTLANQAGLWANRPRFYEVPTEVLIGELSQVAVGSVVRVELDYPGLDGVWMLVLGREGDARPGTVNLTLWG